MNYFKELTFLVTKGDTTIDIINTNTYPIILNTSKDANVPVNTTFNIGALNLHFLLLWKTDTTDYVGVDGLSIIPMTGSKNSISINENAYNMKVLAIVEYNTTIIYDYKAGELCLYQDDIYVANINVQSGKAFNIGDWTIFDINDTLQFDAALDYAVGYADIPFDDFAVDVYLSYSNVGMEYTFNFGENFAATSETLLVNGVSKSITPGVDFVYTFTTEDLQTVVYSSIDAFGVTHSIIKSFVSMLEIQSAFSVIPATASSLDYSFINRSINIGTSATYLWDFGDGSSTSSDKDPTHTYAKILRGTVVNVSLTSSKVVNGITYTSVETNAVTIGVPDCKDLYGEEYYTDACHSFVSIDTVNVGSYRAMRIYDYFDNLITTVYVDETDTEIPFTVKKDGVYIAKLFTLDGPEGNDVSMVKSFPVYTFCKADKCYYELIKMIMCCDNYCTDDCDENTKAEVRKMRDALTRINSVLGLINKYVYLERNKYLGITTISDTRDKYINRVQVLSELLLTVVDRCNNCFESINNTSLSGCSKCN